MNYNSMKYNRRWSIEDIGIFRSFTSKHSYSEWTEKHKIKLKTEIKDIDSLLKETKQAVIKILDIYRKT